MKAYTPYVNDLKRLLLDQRAESAFPGLAERAVNGEASSRLTELVSAHGLKRSGAFFSSSALSARAAARIEFNGIECRGLIIDPACGAGNLLLAAAQKLPVQRSLSATLRCWGQRLAGFDLHAEFIIAAHLRLAILALLRGAEFDLPANLSLEVYFPHIKQGDGLRGLIGLAGATTHMLINPPYGIVTAHQKCLWSKGKVTKAAVFIDQCLETLPPNVHVSAILPDVLRAGSRYQRWRQSVEERAEVLSITPEGNFGTADVDVFLLTLNTGAGQRSASPRKCWWEDSKASETVGDRFEVHVGAVVPHRLADDEGPLYPFVHAKALPFWGVFTPGDEEVSFAGKAVCPPFVVVRRTSSPSDRHRALGTIIRGSKFVAVENHLVVCSPKSGGVTACKTLLKVLQQPSTNSFLNQRIRCRHLTVGVVKDIPWVAPQ